MMFIGIDIGGTKIRALVWTGKRVARALQFATPNNEHDLQKKLVALVASLGGANAVQGIGIGAAGTVKGTTLLFSPNIPCMRQFDFKRLYPSAIPLRVDNDARCFARAEFLRGAGRGASSLFALTIGSGIGRAYGENGATIKLKRFEYPEPWERSYQILRGRRDDKRLARFLSLKLSSLLKPYSPERIVIGGGVLERKGFLQELRAAFKANGFNLEIQRARVRKNAVALGAALLFTGAERK